MIGKATPFTSATTGGTDNSPPTPADDVSTEFYTWDSTVALKNISSSNISYALPRRDWVNSTTYENPRNPRAPQRAWGAPKPSPKWYPKSNQNSLQKLKKREPKRCQKSNPKGSKFCWTGTQNLAA